MGKNNARYKENRAKETEEEKKVRLARNNANYKENRAKETEEERKVRLAKKKKKKTRGKRGIGLRRKPNSQRSSTVFGCGW